MIQSTVNKSSTTRATPGTSPRGTTRSPARRSPAPSPVGRSRCTAPKTADPSPSRTPAGTASHPCRWAKSSATTRSSARTTASATTRRAAAPDAGAGDHQPERDRALVPVVERYRYVWVWIGDPTLADPDTIPDMHQMTDPDWTGDGELIYAPCNYQLVLDNLMDLTHEEFVHASSIGQAELSESDFVTTHDDTTVTVERWMLNIEPPPFWLKNMRDKFPGFEGKRRPLADHPLRGAVDDLHRRRRREGGHRSAGGRPQPGRQRLRDEHDHARDRTHLPLLLVVPAQLPARQPAHHDPAAQRRARRLRRRRGDARRTAGGDRRQPRLRVLQPQHRRGRHVGASPARAHARGRGPLARPRCRRAADVAVAHTVVWQQATVVESVALTAAHPSHRPGARPCRSQSTPGVARRRALRIGGDDASTLVLDRRRRARRRRRSISVFEAEASRGGAARHARPRPGDRRRGHPAPAGLSRCGSARRATCCSPAASASPRSRRWPRAARDAGPTTARLLRAVSRRAWPTSTTCRASTATASTCTCASERHLARRRRARRPASTRRRRAVHVRADPPDGCRAPRVGRARARRCPTCASRPSATAAGSSAQAFVVRRPRARPSSHVVQPHQSMLEALEAAGVDTLSDCRKGECGLCEVRVLDLEGAIDHRDVFYSERQRDAKLQALRVRLAGMRAGDGGAVRSRSN